MSKPKRKSAKPNNWGRSNGYDGAMPYYGCRLPEAHLTQLKARADELAAQMGVPVSVPDLIRKYIKEGLER